jgi:hypothetical protein
MQEAKSQLFPGERGWGLGACQPVQPVEQSQDVKRVLRTMWPGGAFEHP